MLSESDGALARRTAEEERAPLLPSAEPTQDAAPRKRRFNKSAAVAMLVLIVAMVSMVILGFILPRMAQHYVEETLQFELKNIKVGRLTGNGAETQVDLALWLDDARSTAGAFERRIANKLVGFVGTIPLTDTLIEGSLLYNGEHKVVQATPDDFSLQLTGSAQTLTTITSHVTLLHLEPLADLAAAILSKDITKLNGKAHVTTTLHKVFSLRKSLTKLVDYKLPEGLDGDLPPFDLSHLHVRDDKLAGLTGSAMLKVFMHLPLDIAVPSVSVDVLIPGCEHDKILLATGHNTPLQLHSKDKSITVQAEGHVAPLPKEVTTACSKQRPSPLDQVMQLYLAGNSTRFFVRGSPAGQDDASWLQRLLSQVTLPIDLPGSQSDQLARNIELSDVKFNIGGFFRQEKPKISGNIKAVIDVPAGINVKVDVRNVRVLADLIYKGEKFATFESPGWAPASSHFANETILKVEAQLRDAPVTITDNDVFTGVVSGLLGGQVKLDVSGVVDVRVRTSLGELEPRGLPLVAKGIEIGGLDAGLPSELKAQVKDLGLVGSTAKTLDLAAQVTIQNPTPYGGYIRELSVLMLYNGSTIGSLTGREVHIEPLGQVSVSATLHYNPTLHGNIDDNRAAYSEMLSRYLSEMPVNVTLRAHNASIPGMPNLSQALAHGPLELSLPVPQLAFPGMPDDDAPNNSTGSRFLVSAKFHVLSSTAQFTLRNPLNVSFQISNLAARARYHEDEIGVIDYTYPLTICGDSDTSETPRLPVSWSLPASDILRKAIRGTLKVNATAQCDVSIGQLRPFPLTLDVREVGAGVGV